MTGPSSRRHRGDWRVSWCVVTQNGRDCVRTHPGGGQYDVLQIVDPKDGPGAIMLNRNGTIQIHGRFDGAGAPPWDATEWADYVAADPREFLGRLESAAGLKAPGVTPRATPTTLTYRVLAAIAATAVKTVHPIEIEHGYIDTSGYGGGPNRVLDQFSVSAALTAVRDDDLFGQPGYRFWIAMQERSTDRRVRADEWNGLDRGPPRAGGPGERVQVGRPGRGARGVARVARRSRCAVRVRIHRGAAEIGGNCIEVAQGDDRIVLDLGRPLAAGWNTTVQLPAIDGLDGTDPNLRGVVLSHPHMDHYGLAEQVASNVPVYLGREAERVLRAASFFSPMCRLPKLAGHLADRVPVELGPFRITPYLVDHSAFDAYSLLVETAGRRLFYSGDFRAHGRKARLFEQLVADPPAADVMLMEGTNVRRDGRVRDSNDGAGCRGRSGEHLS